MTGETVSIAALAGLLAGLVHALAGPDHLAAVAPLVADCRGRRGRWRVGLSWGAGHSLGVWGVGLLALALRDVLPIERLSSWSERLVGAALIAVGLWGLARAFGRRLPAPHGHDHGPQAPGRPGLAAFGVGTLHGLAGSAHVLGLFPALALASRAASLAYVGAFGLGTVAAMAAFSTLLGGLAERFIARGAYQALLGGLSAAAIVVGGIWLLP